jgi:glycosyltransferase involved in cell wall biosynthesis
MALSAATKQAPPRPALRAPAPCGFALTLPPVPLAGDVALVDLTRLLRAARRPFATGIDRIDLAMAMQLRARLGAGCRFVGASRFGPWLAPRPWADAFLRALGAAWRGEGRGQLNAVLSLRRAAMAAGLARGALGGWGRLAAARATYVNAGHGGLLRRPGALRRIDPLRLMPALVYLHDLIPLERPEVQTPQSRAHFDRFLEETGAARATILANSADTARRAGALARRRGWQLSGVIVAPPRLDPLAPHGPPGARVAAILADPRPYFLALGTIEPRKNHALLVQIWRRLAARPGAPRLVIAGRRGWQVGPLLWAIDHDPALAGLVVRIEGASDRDALALLAGARALVMPSLAEGLGLPALEAAALGVPAILSDLPALRETGGRLASYLDPMDAAAWADAIERIA